jgi:hypothetical protein
MAMYQNPSWRKFGGKDFYLAGEGLEKAAAQAVADYFRNRKKNARVIDDERVGRIRWAIYVEGKFDRYPAARG